MKVGLLADIHANADALAAVLSAARGLGVSSLIVAGDFVGYYYDAERVLDLLADWPWTGVQGNHEAMLARWLDGHDHTAITGRHGHGIAAAADRLSPDRIQMLLSLPHRHDCVIDGKHVLVGHGSPWDTDAYVYPDAPAAIRDRLAEAEADIVVLGHTHYPMLWRLGRQVVVNPGSVGQPRDRKPGACWAVWDTDSGAVDHRREAYDASGVIRQAAARDPGLPYLQTVLTRTQ